MARVWCVRGRSVARLCFDAVRGGQPFALTLNESTRDPIDAWLYQQSCVSFLILALIRDATNDESRAVECAHTCDESVVPKIPGPFSDGVRRRELRTACK